MMINFRYRLLFQNPDTGLPSGDSGGGFSDLWSAPEPTPSAPEPKATETVEPAAETAEPVVPAAPAPVDAKAVAREVLAEQQAAAAAAAPQAPAYTQEQLDDYFQVYKPTPDTMQLLLNGGDDAITAFTDIRNGLMKQSFTLAKALVAQEVAKMREEVTGQFSPMLTEHNKASSAKAQAEFYESNADLSGQDKTVELIYKVMKAEGTTFADRASALKALADRTREHLGLAQAPTPTGSAQPPAPTKQTPAATPRPAQLSAGTGVPGAGNSASDSSFKEIWAGGRR